LAGGSTTGGDYPAGVIEPEPVTESAATTELGPTTDGPRVIEAMRSRSLVVIFVAVGSLIALLLIGVVVFGGTLTDPAEILRRGFQAGAEADSLHMSLSMEGNVTDPETGANMPLDGITFEGDVDVTVPAMHFTFAAPMLLGLTGEMILIGEDLYFKSSLSGTQWVLMPFSSADLPMPLPTADPSAVAAQVEELLAIEGVTVEKLEDVSCGDGTCYHVRLTIPLDAMAALAGSSGAADYPADFGSVFTEEMFGGPLVVDQLYDRNSLLLYELSFNISPQDVGDIGLTMTFTDYNVPVEISPPPSDQITDEGEFPLFPY
jgi:hypothetical protein